MGFAIVEAREHRLIGNTGLHVPNLHGVLLRVYAFNERAIACPRVHIPRG